jgi:hypothetical protein
MKIVFIHLGKSKPRHLIPNLAKISLEYPELDMNLVLSSDSTIHDIPKNVNVFTYIASNSTEAIFSKFNLDSKFRQGFWRYSLERLFALESFHATHPNASLLHIESDILILPDFPFDQIAESRNLMWNSYNESHDVSALLFSPNFEETTKLLDEVRNALDVNSFLSDMTVLNYVRRHSSLRVSLLAAHVSELPGLLNRSSKFLLSESSGCSNSGIYDGAAIGMWLLGHDPRNNYGRYTIHSMGPIRNGDSAIDPSNVRYEIDTRGSVFLCSDSSSRVKVQLWNLHVHSKDLNLFGSNWVYHLTSFVKLSKEKQEIHKFSLMGLLILMFESIYSRTFLKFVYGLPPIHWIRRKISPLLRKLGIRG